MEGHFQEQFENFAIDGSRQNEGKKEGEKVCAVVQWAKIRKINAFGCLRWKNIGTRYLKNVDFSALCDTTHLIFCTIFPCLTYCDVCVSVYYKKKAVLFFLLFFSSTRLCLHACVENFLEIRVIFQLTYPLLLCGTSCPFNVQVIVGVGLPRAEHFKETSGPGCKVWSMNRYVMIGAASKI